jgi:multiple sugar transport system permease protein
MRSDGHPSFVDQDQVAAARGGRQRLYEFLSRRRVMVAFTVVPVVLLLLLIIAFPILWAFVGSFFEINAFNPAWRWVGVDNYVTTLLPVSLSGSLFWQSVWLSVVFAASSVLIHVVVGTAFALLLNKEFRFKKAVSALVFLPFLIPTAILGFGIQFMLNANFGVVNWMLVDVGLIDSTRGWLGDPNTSMATVVLTNSWKFYSLVTIMVYARLQAIPRSHYETARTMGAGAWRQFRDITLPNLRGVLFLVVLLDGVWMLFKFDIIWILTRGGSGREVYISVIHAYTVAFRQLQLGHAAAISMLLFVIVGAAAIAYFVVLQPSREVRTE